jgi:hypothetical protein
MYVNVHIKNNNTDLFNQISVTKQEINDWIEK